MNNRWEVLENFFTLDDTTPVKDAVKKFLEHYEEGKFLILCGEKGTGKSHLTRYIYSALSENATYFQSFPEKIEKDADVFIFENINFYSTDQLEKLYKFLSENRQKSYVITVRESCDSPTVKTVRGILGEKGDYFFLPPPPYELQRAIMEKYLEMENIEISSHTLELILEKLEWPAPIRFIEMVKTKSILLSESMDDQSVFTLIREFLGSSS